MDQEELAEVHAQVDLVVLETLEDQGPAQLAGLVLDWEFAALELAPGSALGSGQAGWVLDWKFAALEWAAGLALGLAMGSGLHGVCTDIGR